MDAVPFLVAKPTDMLSLEHQKKDSPVGQRLVDRCGTAHKSNET